ncbi:GH1 family beta-glucosidase [uncultured Microbulbifer sp.]|uniref:GH1 family beta-glucosidase n=1 Tax=uncultured Microbulbifer sp. TaxID=348147 RepID=UPI0026359F5F|nr:GH1 family beta-glucosidase [uncultured Microbulbifer sp.]
MQNNKVDSGFDAAARAGGSRRFPDGFLWGSATAAFQIEGATTEGGRGLSIWDTFCAEPGRIADGSNANFACDHYHRWRQDIAMMADLGLQAYRFSLAWPRIFPAGRGAVNQAGIDFYQRLIDGLLAADIEPMVTLFHWDLPQALQDHGGFLNREICHHFADYAETAARAFGDRVKTWFTHNEPNVFAFNGHLHGSHAPGLQDVNSYFRVAHHLNLSHGMAVARVRGNVPNSRIGPVIHQALFDSADGSEAGRQAVEQSDTSFNRLFTDAMLKGEYPASLVPMLEAQSGLVQDGDLAAMSAPSDFLGINHYTRYWVKPDGQSPTGVASDDHRVPGAHYTALDWEVFPQGMYQVLTDAHERYGLPVMITENGCAMDDTLVDVDGVKSVADDSRIEFLSLYLGAVHRAIDDGVDVLGFLQWSLMDNFEWAEGLEPRFGLVWVDYDTGERTVKDSGLWYRGVIARNGLPLAVESAKQSAMQEAL